MQRSAEPEVPASRAFGALLREYRLAAELTQAALAERAGLSTRGVQDLELGVSHPYPDTCRRLVAALGLSAEVRARFEAAASPRPRRRAAIPAADGQTAEERQASRPTNLPRPVTRLIGREQQLVELRRYLSGSRLLTLTGAGGCGKTRLALQLSADALLEFPNGAWLVELAPLADPESVPQAAIAALGARERPGRAPIDTLVALLRPKAALLVLDNCEHLVEACARLAETLLVSCPRLRLLVTSREPLRIPGEVIWRVPSLALPAADQALLPDELAGYAAVQLFLERARAVKPDFALTPSNVAAVARLCTRLDGIPLGIELAATRLLALTPEQILERLGDAFRLLVVGSRTAPTRQRTLRATLDWSHTLLSGGERVLFRRLAVFAGGFDLAAAEAVGAGGTIEQSEVLDLLGWLVDKSMVLADEQSEQARYRLLEPVRQYARERLTESGEAEAITRRHAEHYLALAERTEPELTGPHQAACVARLEREHANLRVALSRLYEDAAGAAPLLRLAAALGWFWFVCGYYGEGRQWLDRALAAGDESATRQRALALGVAAHLRRLQGEPQVAEALAERAVALCREHGDRAGLAEMLVCLGLVAVARGDPERALLAYRESLALCRTLGDRRGAGLALGVLGEALSMAGDLEGAVAALDEALAQSRSVNDTRSTANWLQFQARVAHQRGAGCQAAALYAESLATAGPIGDRRRVAICLEGLAMVVAEAGHAPRAARLLGAAWALREATGSLVEPADEAAYARCTEALRWTLGEAAFAATWDAGRALPLEQALAEALATGSETPLGPQRVQPASGEKA